MRRDAVLFGTRNQSRVIGIETVPRNIAADEPVHVVALIGDDDGKVRQRAVGDVGIESIKPDDFFRAVRIILYSLEVHEAIVLRRVEPFRLFLRLVR